MKQVHKLFSFLLLFSLLLSPLLPGETAYGQGDESWPADPEVYSESAVLMEATTGTILYEKNATETRYPASITKIMTVLLTLENGKMDDEIVFSEDSVRKTEGTRIGYDVGEVISVESCIYSVMLGSDNQCAYALAEYIGGTYEHFVEMMNQRAEEIGCVNTHFNNPHGLPDDDHYTCAYDMALITKEAMENASFRKVFGTKQYTVPTTNKAESRLINNHHQMVLDRDANYHYEGITGGKTGYTSRALNTLVTTATQNNMELICVVMKTSSTHYSDTRNLLNYGFQNFSLVNISENEKKFNQESEEFLQAGKTAAQDKDFSLSLNTEDDIILPNGVDFSAAQVSCDYQDLEPGTIARLTYSLGSHTVGSTNITISIEEEETQVFAPEDTTDSSQSTSHVLKINLGTLLFILILAALAGGILFLLIRYRNSIGLTRLHRKFKLRRHQDYPSKYKHFKFKK
jgi:D-alanyl-D-alanine carboxypeptidase